MGKACKACAGFEGLCETVLRRAVKAIKDGAMKAVYGSVPEQMQTKRGAWCSVGQSGCGELWTTWP